MKFFVFLGFCVALSVADKLNNVYLPPSSAGTAGGSGSFLSAPHSTSSFGSQSFQRTGPSFSSSGSSFSGSSYVPPASGPVTSTYSAAASSGYQRFGGNQPQVNILRYNNDNNGDGSYRFEYETENKISQQEEGSVKSFGGAEEAAVVVRGSYSYISPEGQHITVNYVADENGFRPEGEHLPTPPPIPEAIQRSLSVSAAGSSQQDYYSGGYQSQGRPDRQYLAPKSTGGASGYRY